MANTPTDVAAVITHAQSAVDAAVEAVTKTRNTQNTLERNIAVMDKKIGVHNTDETSHPRILEQLDSMFYDPIIAGLSAVESGETNTWTFTVVGRFSSVEAEAFKVTLADGSTETVAVSDTNLATWSHAFTGEDKSTTSFNVQAIGGGFSSRHTTQNITISHHTPPKFDTFTTTFPTTVVKGSNVTFQFSGITDVDEDFANVSIACSSDSITFPINSSMKMDTDYTFNVTSTDPTTAEDVIITFTANDKFGLSSTKTMQVHINANPNVSQTVVTGMDYLSLGKQRSPVVVTGVTDPDGEADDITYAISSTYTGVSFTKNTGIKLGDGIGIILADTVTTDGGLPVAEGDSIPFTFTFTDKDGGSTTYNKTITVNLSPTCTGTMGLHDRISPTTTISGDRTKDFNYVQITSASDERTATNDLTVTVTSESEAFMFRKAGTSDSFNLKLTVPYTDLDSNGKLYLDFCCTDASQAEYWRGQSIAVQCYLTDENGADSNKLVQYVLVKNKVSPSLLVYGLNAFHVVGTPGMNTSWFYNHVTTPLLVALNAGTINAQNNTSKWQHIEYDNVTDGVLTIPPSPVGWTEALVRALSGDTISYDKGFVAAIGVTGSISGTASNGDVVHLAITGSPGVPVLQNVDDPNFVVMPPTADTVTRGSDWSFSVTYTVTYTDADTGETFTYESGTLEIPCKIANLPSFTNKASLRYATPAYGGEEYSFPVTLSLTDINQTITNNDYVVFYNEGSNTAATSHYVTTKGSLAITANYLPIGGSLTTLRSPFLSNPTDSAITYGDDGLFKLSSDITVTIVAGKEPVEATQNIRCLLVNPFGEVGPTDYNSALGEDYGTFKGTLLPVTIEPIAIVARPSITSPSNGATVSFYNGFTVTWSDIAEGADLDEGEFDRNGN